MRVITANYARRLQPGEYKAVTESTVTHYRGTGDSRVDVEYTTYKPGEHFEVPASVNGFWYGLNPNGKISVIEMNDPKFTASISGIEGSTYQPLHGSINDDNAIWMLANNGTAPSESRKLELRPEFDRIRIALLNGEAVATKTAIITPDK